VAYVVRKIAQRIEDPGPAYDELVDDVLRRSHVNARVAERLGEEIGDPLRAKELLLSMVLAQVEPAPEPPPADNGDRQPLGSFLSEGYQAIKSRGFSARKVLELAGSLGLARVLGRGAGKLLGPLGSGLAAFEVGKTVYDLQKPNHPVCALAVAQVGQLRSKYFPLPADKLRAIDVFIASLDQECRECGRRLKGPEAVCILCSIALHDGCGTEVERIDTGRKGRACSACRRKDLEEGGLLTPEGILNAVAYQRQLLNNRLDRSVEDLERTIVTSAREIERSIDAATENVQEFRKDTVKDLERLLKNAFGYLYVMFFTTVFLTLLGVGYFRAAQASPGGTFNPAVFFRISLVVMILVPAAIWFAGALRRAAQNARREDFEKSGDGRRLALKDYLFGFLYYDHPVENIWGPITLIGFTIAVIMWLLFR
jgi:hypothetical protein